MFYHVFLLYTILYHVCYSLQCFTMFLGYIRFKMDAMVRAVAIGCIRNLCMYWFRFFTIDDIYCKSCFTMFFYNTMLYHVCYYIPSFTMFMGYIRVIMDALVMVG